MKSQYFFRLLSVLLVISATLRAQENQIVVKRVPFEGDEKEIIYEIFQDTTGLLWFSSKRNWYTSDGEMIYKVPMPEVSDGSSFVRGMYYGRVPGNFYLGGDSVRIYNPYSRRIIQSIGIDTSFDTKGVIPLLFNILPGPDSVLWAVFSHLENDFAMAPGYTVMQSVNGLPFKPVGPKSKNGFINSQNMTIRGDQLFIATPDTIRQYDVKGRLIKTQVLPSLAVMPIGPKYKGAKEGNVEFLHFIQNTEKHKTIRALYYLNPNAKEFESIILSDLNELSPLNTTVPFRLNKTGTDYWLMGSRMSLYHFIPHNDRATDYSKYILQQHPELPYFQDYVWHVFQDKTGTIWVTTATNGVFKLSSTKEPFKRYLGEKRAYPFCAYNSCLIRGIAADGEGNIYFGYDYGIRKLEVSRRELRDFKFKNSEELKAVYSLTYFNQKLYLNAMEIDPETGNTIPIIPGKNANRITHLIDQENGEMWIADAGSATLYNQPVDLYRYSFESRELKLIKHFERAGYMDQVSQLYLSPTTNTLFMATTYDGLYELDRNGAVLCHIKSDERTKSLTQVLAIYEDKNQQLWIGSSSGLSRLDLKTKEFIKTAHQPTSSFEPGSVYSIHSQNDTFCWLGTSSGLCRLNTETGEVRNFNMFPFQAQMEFNRGSTYQSPDGTLYFGSVEGLFVFHPDSLVKDARLEEQFPIQVSRFSRFDVKKDTIVRTYQDLVTATTFNIYPKHRYFSLDVFVPDFRDAEKNTYTWWLEGYDSRWIKPTTLNTIRYDNLPPGTYTLHVKGGVTADYYQSSERQFRIIVHQVWYKTGWARSLYIATFLGLVYLLYRYQVGQQLEKAEASRLKELDTLKTRLYTNITHEFRTPLTVIMGMTNNIRGHSEEKKLIQRNSKNLLRLINQMLDLSKLDSGILKMDKVQGDIVTYLQYLTESFYSMADEKNIRLTFYPEVRELIMDYDEAKIQHIVYNLLTNAIKFTADGGRVVLHIKQLERNDREWLQIKVSDTGIGISAEDLPRIFDRFYQGDASSTRREAGTGIGLALTKELIEMIGGMIVVESQLGKGTDFILHLPVIRDLDTLKKEAELIASAEAFSGDVFSNLVPPIDLSTLNKSAETPSLLIIEDNRDVVTYIESILKREYHIEIARNGQKGIDKALEMIPDIIISDVMMPEKNGYEVCQALKNDERTSHIPIILLTAKAAVEDRIEGLKEGADAYLTKPFNKEELFIRLEKLITLRKALQKRYSGYAILEKHDISKAPPSLEDQFLQKLIKVVQERLDDPDLAVHHLCRAAHLSNTQVNRKLKALTGKTPSQFIRSIRLQKALQLLQITDLNISEIAYDVGFSDPNYFSRSFSEEFGHPPNVIRK